MFGGASFTGSFVEGVSGWEECIHWAHQAGKALHQGRLDIIDALHDIVLDQGKLTEGFGIGRRASR